MKEVLRERRGVAVFVPTRAEVEQIAKELGDRWQGLPTAFYHGGEPIRVIRPFLDGQVRRPFLLAMTAAGQSALNIAGWTPWGSTTRASPMSLSGGARG